MGEDPRPRAHPPEGAVGGDAGGSLARRVLSSTVKDWILQQIRRGGLAPGSRLVEIRLARALGVSQTPVREALRDLATLGVVEILPYRGARVRRPTRKELVDAIRVRATLEAMAGRLAAASITSEELDGLKGCLDAMVRAAEQGDAHEMSTQNAAFHAAIVAAARNEALARAWEVLDPPMRTYVTATLPGLDLTWLARRHTEVFEALQARDPDGTEGALRRHLAEAEAITAAGSAAGEAGEGGSPSPPARLIDDI